MLSDIDQLTQRPRANRAPHPLFKLLATLLFAIVFLAAVVLTGGRVKNDGPVAADVIGTPANP